MSQWPSDHRYVIPVAPGPDVVTVTIDGVEVQAPRGELLIKVAQQHGTYIPRFCWHERMKPVGMCRMCLVEVEGMRGLQISCATPVVDGMVVRTQSRHRQVRAGRRARVPARSTTRSTARCATAAASARCRTRRSPSGPGESRFVEEKRHFEKPIPISDLVLLDRERCIQCGRCTRFAAEVAGDPLIDFGGRGGTTEVITYPDEPFSSYFSGQHGADLPGRCAHRERRTGSGPARGTCRPSRRRARRARSAAAARCRARRTGSSGCSESTPSR